MNDQSPINSEKSILSNAAIILVHPKYPENIGAAARAVMNMGISQLVVVRDEKPDTEKMLKMATHKAAHLIENLAYHTELGEAVSSFSYLVGSSARKGRKRHVDNCPRKMAEKVLPLLRENRVGLMFGPEHRGLTNDDLKYCDLTVTIPTDEFSSLNLAQAVAILCYELYYKMIYGDKDIVYEPKQASSHELEGMYEHVEQLLDEIGFLKTNDSSYWMRNIRKVLGRRNLLSKEARIIRGFCRQFLWYTEQKKEESGSPGNDELSDKKVITYDV